MFSTFAIANRILDEAERRRIPVSPLKLQKLVYYAHGWWLGFKGEPLIDETIEAWQYGPVVPSIYHEFKHRGNQPITDRATSIDWDAKDGLDFPAVKPASGPGLDSLMDQIFQTYGQRSATELSAMTHAKGTPWAKTYKGADTPRGKDIENDVIKAYFSDLIERAKQKKVEAARAQA